MGLLYNVIWGKCVAPTTVGLSYAFPVHLFTLRKKDQFGGSLKFLFLRHKTGARRTNTHCTVRLLAIGPMCRHGDQAPFSNEKEAAAVWSGAETIA